MAYHMQAFQAWQRTFLALIGEGPKKACHVRHLIADHVAAHLKTLHRVSLKGDAKFGKRKKRMRGCDEAAQQCILIPYEMWYKKGFGISQGKASLFNGQ